MENHIQTFRRELSHFGVRPADGGWRMADQAVGAAATSASWLAVRSASASASLAVRSSLPETPKMAFTFSTNATTVFRMVNASLILLMMLQGLSPVGTAASGQQTSPPSHEPAGLRLGCPCRSPGLVQPPGSVFRTDGRPTFHARVVRR